MSKYRNKLILLSILSLTSGAFAQDLSVEEMVFGGEKPSEAVEFVEPVEPVEAVPPGPMCCYSNSRPERISVRHIESKGIGYNQGYSTLEGFFIVPAVIDTIWFPFLDLRGHIFNNGKLACNVGLGLRYLSTSRVWGINSYYDYRQSPHRNFSQYGLGLESLGRVWDFRVNGYLPVGKKESNYYGYGTTFEGFKGNSLFISRKQKIAFKGINAEMGAHATLSDNILLYAAAGPYYFNHRTHNAWGGEVRVAFDFTKYVRLEGNTSYDNIFKWIGQGQLSLNFPFGPKQKLPVRKCNTCCNEVMLRDRVVQRVDRDEIIVLDSKKTKTVAIDPATGLPYVFIFVNNTSSSSGTFESPYPTIDQAVANSAPGNIIYVYEGDGTPYAPANSLTLQDNQKLWGAGIAQQLPTAQGFVTIPAMSAALPQVSLTNVVANFGIILGNNNEVAGMNFMGVFTENVIFGGPLSALTGGITNAYIHDNLCSTGGTAVQFTNCFGDLIVMNNQIINSAGTGIEVDNQGITNVDSNLVISNNNILNTGPTSFGVGIEINLNVSSGLMQLLIENNTISGSGSDNIGVYAGDFVSEEGQVLCGTIRGNIATNSLMGDGIDIYLVSGSANVNVDIVNNICTGNMGPDFLFDSLSGNLCASLSGNVSSNNGATVGYYFSQVTAGVVQVDLRGNNLGTIQTLGAITSVGSCSCQ